MKTSSSNAWSRFFKLVKLEKKDILQIFYYAIFAGALSLSLPLGIQAIINLIQGAQISSSWIILVVLVTLGVGFTGTLQIMQLRIIETLQQRIFTRASFELTYRFPKLKLDSLRKYYLPELANRFFDTLSIQKGLAKILIDVPSALIQILFTLILLSLYHPFFILFGLGLVSLMFFVFQYTVRRGLETSLEESKHKYRVAHWIQEIARSIVSFKLSAKSDFGLRKNDELVSDYLSARENHFQVIKLQYIKLIGFKITITAGLLIIGGALVLNQQMNIGQFVAAEIIILLTIASVEKLIVSLETLYDILTSIEKLGGLVDLATEKQGGKELNPNSDFTIELKNIYYVIPEIDKPILSGVNLKINPKDKILIRGISGSGKSSLLNLIAGIINPTQGTVFIGQHNLKALNLNQYRSFLGLSLPEEVLFKGTIKENLTFGDTSITESIIQDLLNVLGLESFIKNQSMGVESNVNSEGKYISNSIRKKLILARALLHQPKCLILEDPLDIFAIEETKKIIDYLCLEKHPWSIVVVSNNNYWETKCNQIFELKKEV
ncbi:ATP-binding cassette domain-containing protein [Flavobacteriaceae bacterium]|nr:ATP-binding cassette domain-containing protein [Flavobacteriaceae bacterium]MDC3368955.1 ATP-binding cassette domain-containing protein [Flavobacteriaceae bacterium]